MTKKWILRRVLDASFFEGGFGEGFGRILEGFWKDFGRILEGFWEDFGKDFVEHKGKMWDKL